MFRFRLLVTKLGELIVERHHYCRELQSINDFILRNWGHVLTPFLDMYPGSVECGSARKGDSNWYAGELPMRVVADEKIAKCG